MAVVALFGAWARDTRRPLREMVARRWPLAVGLGAAFAATRAEDGASHPGGIEFIAALGWRGVPYGAADGLLLSAFAIVASLAMTAVYHAGCSDFRSHKLRDRRSACPRSTGIEATRRTAAGATTGPRMLTTFGPDWYVFEVSAAGASGSRSGAAGQRRIPCRRRVRSSRTAAASAASSKRRLVAARAVSPSRLRPIFRRPARGSLSGAGRRPSIVIVDSSRRGA